ncbi:cytidylyltransferase domain-containing protein [Kurthia populi]|uniref:Cytidylyltransferase domain-containing protein n=1 Tax=Kurthia populi TaxID=1562132 RepID=A0ABW5Y6I3_9BACL
MKTIVIIQARMGSSRLPGKILMPLGSTDNLTYVIERCKKIDGVSKVLVATSSLSQDDAVEKWCEEHQLSCYRGSEEDVLDRFIQAAKPYDPDYVIRVTADCPFVDYEMASDMVALMKKEQVDIIDLEGQLPRGLAVEVISYKALQYIDEKGHENRHREHVTYYAYEFKEQFTRVSYVADEMRNEPPLRITLDTVADYELLSKVASHFDDVFVSSIDVIKYLIEHPEVAKINAHIEQKPVV